MARVLRVEGEAGATELTAEFCQDTEFCQDSPVVMLFSGDHVEARGKENGAVARLNHPEGLLRALRHHNAFRHAHLAVVRPTHYADGCFACYTNFVPKLTRNGEPLGHPHGALRALRHLHALLRACEAQAPSARGCGEGDEGDEGRQAAELVLLGFSKGGVVLNQLLYEMAHLQERLEEGGGGGGGGGGGADATVVAEGALWGLVHRIRRIHYVDVGANSRGSVCTDPRVLQAMSRLASQQALRVALHGTPRQWSDARRPWVAEEKDRCVRLCREAGLPATAKLYFADEPPSLDMHFRVLDAFEPEEAEERSSG